MVLPEPSWWWPQERNAARPPDDPVAPAPEIAPQEDAAAPALAEQEAPAPADLQNLLQDPETLLLLQQLQLDEDNDPDIMNRAADNEANIMDEDNEPNIMNRAEDNEANNGMRTPEDLWPIGSRLRRPEPTPCRITGPYGPQRPVTWESADFQALPATNVQHSNEIIIYDEVPPFIPAPGFGQLPPDPSRPSTWLTFDGLRQRQLDQQSAVAFARRSLDLGWARIDDVGRTQFYWSQDPVDTD